ncbi:hypothetical protein Amsp01_094890 [Amycolatopsis sp. NBRC 101858]|nr:hypothetical protein Amsp01_094890 [Amycolatopsis sp. NBRC 101858]
MLGMTAEHSAYECRERGVKITGKAEKDRSRETRGTRATPSGTRVPPVFVWTTRRWGHRADSGVLSGFSQSTFAEPGENVHSSWSGP